MDLLWFIHTDLSCTGHVKIFCSISETLDSFCLIYWLIISFKKCHLSTMDTEILTIAFYEMWVINDHHIFVPVEAVPSILRDSHPLVDIGLSRLLVDCLKRNCMPVTHVLYKVLLKISIKIYQKRYFLLIF